MPFRNGWKYSPSLLNILLLTSDWCIMKLAHLFTTFGLPLVIVSDSGKQFRSLNFKQYLYPTIMEFVREPIAAPLHPSRSNSLAERCVQTVKTRLLSMSEGKVNYKIR